MTMRQLIGLAIAGTILCIAPRVSWPENVYQSPADFVAEAFPDGLPEPSVVWLNQEIKDDLRRILGHRYRGLRVRYWGHEGRTAWILEEIGKYKPITTGFVVENEGIVRVRVLVYRESHGWEIRYPFFTDQFRDLSLNDDLRLDGTVDNISGATLSVNALRRLARVALYLHGKTPHGSP